MFCLKVWISVFLMFIPEANAQGVKDLDGGAMQMPVVAGSKHYEKQVAREAAPDDAGGSALFVPILAIIIAGTAYFLVVNPKGREVVQSYGLTVPENPWSKMEVDKMGEEGAKWAQKAMDAGAPLVQEAMTAIGCIMAMKNDGTEMNSCFDEKKEEPSAQSIKLEVKVKCRSSAEKKPQKPVQADKKADLMEAQEVDLMGSSNERGIQEQPKEEPTDLLGQDQEDELRAALTEGLANEGLKEPCFDPMLGAAEEEDTSAAFMAHRGAAAAMSPEDFLKSLSASAPPPPAQANFMDNDDLLG